MRAFVFALLCCAARSAVSPRQNHYNLRSHNVQATAYSKQGTDLLNDMKTFHVVHFQQLSAVAEKTGTSQFPRMLQLEFSTDNTTFQVHLTKNDVFGPDYKEIRMDGETEEVLSVTERSSVPDCHYHGRLGDTGGTVFLSTCEGVSGVIHAPGQHIHIIPIGRHFSEFRHRTLGVPVDLSLSLTGSHIAVHNQDITSTQQGECGLEHQLVDGHGRHHEARGGSHARNQMPEFFVVGEGDDSEAGGNFKPHSHGARKPLSFADLSAKASTFARGHTQRLQACTAGSTTSGSTKTIEVVIVNDPSQYSVHGQSTESNTAAIVSLADGYYANSQFQSFCVRMRLVGQLTYTHTMMSDVAYRSCGSLDTTQTTCTTCTGCYDTTTQTCPCTSPLSTSSTEIDTRQLLSTFTSAVMVTRYAKIAAIFNSEVDNIHLFTQRDFDGGTMGLAWVGTMCRRDIYGSAGVTQATGAFQGYTAQVYAHEVGHNWNMQHDTTSGFVMYFQSSASSYSTTFSTESSGYLNSWYTSTYPSAGYIKCLENTISSGYAPPVCGNGLMEAGEQCDPGAETDACCTSTCQLAAGCQCAHTQPCCNAGTLRPSSFVCRPAASSCDVADYCTGLSGECTTDVWANAGTSCTDAKGFASTCYRGACATSRSSFCSTVNSNAYPNDRGCPTATSCTQVQCALPPATTCVRNWNAPAPDGVTCGANLAATSLCVSGTCTPTPSIIAAQPKLGVNPTAAPFRPPTGAPTRTPTRPPTAAPTTLAPTRSPTAPPTRTPTRLPTVSPSRAPTRVPTAMPTRVPTAMPTRTPTATPTHVPTATPTRLPTAAPTATPTAAPTSTPTVVPTATPTRAPTAAPTVTPTRAPTADPTATPTEVPTATPTATPSSAPTGAPTTVTPTAVPTAAPTTVTPTAAPSEAPSTAPSNHPTTQAPTSAPTTVVPTQAPTTNVPTAQPTTVAPTTAPTTQNPTSVPTATPSLAPSASPSVAPTTNGPTSQPVAGGTNAPTAATFAPTTAAPSTAAPTTVSPTTSGPTTSAPTTSSPTTLYPTTLMPTTVAPTTLAPTTLSPTTLAPTTAGPTAAPTTAGPTLVPTAEPTSAPTLAPTAPTEQPTLAPTAAGYTYSPTEVPTYAPTLAPTTAAPTTAVPTEAPTTEAPTTEAPTTEAPTTQAPTQEPTTETPTTQVPTLTPTTEAPTTEAPTDAPTTEAPTDAPTTEAPTTEGPTNAPTQPTALTTESPTPAPSSQPTASPTTLAPSRVPTGQPITQAPAAAGGAQGSAEAALGTGGTVGVAVGVAALVCCCFIILCIAFRRKQAAEPKGTAVGTAAPTDAGGEWQDGPASSPHARRTSIQLESYLGAPASGSIVRPSTVPLEPDFDNAFEAPPSFVPAPDVDGPSSGDIEDDEGANEPSPLDMHIPGPPPVAAVRKQPPRTQFVPPPPPPPQSSGGPPPAYPPPQSMPPPPPDMAPPSSVVMPMTYFDAAPLDDEEAPGTQYALPPSFFQI